MPRETITMYKGDSRAPDGRVSFGDGKTAAEWKPKDLFILLRKEALLKMRLLL